MKTVRIFLLLVAAFFAAVPAHAFSVQIPDFDRLERELRLRPAQKAQYQAAVGASKRALMSVALAGLEIKERLSTEFAKSRPDLNALYQAHDLLVTQSAPLFREAHAEWSRLYAMMDEQQVAIAKSFIRDKLQLIPSPWDLIH